jgi:predicted dehydrogenase
LKLAPLKLGIIGCGWVTEHRHLPALRSLVQAEVVAAVDIDAHCLQRVVEQWRVPRGYCDFRELLADRLVEAVAICLPAQLHAEVAVTALQAGKHVMIEKPLALSLDDCDRVVERAANSTLKAMVGFNMRWHRLVRRAREMVAQGRLGRIASIQTRWTSVVRRMRQVPEWRNRRELGGGVLFEIGVHHFDLWRFLLHREVEEISAFSHSGEWADETAVITARLSDGVLAASVFSDHGGASHDLEICGDAGRLQIACYRSEGLQFHPAGRSQGPLGRLQELASTAKESWRGLPAALRGGDYVDSYRQQWRHFIHAVRSDTPVECSVEDGSRAVQVMLAAAQSASSGRPIPVSQARTAVAGATAQHTSGR